MRILLTGGGTLGSVTPLLAVAEKLRQENPENLFLWLGTKTGPEKFLIEKNEIVFRAILAGKLRRYFSFRNFGAPFLILGGFIQALWYLWRFEPDIVLTAGSFVSVPVAYAARLFKKSVLVHQQDLSVGLANRLMAPVARKITVAFEALKAKFPAEKVVVVGNPARENLFHGRIAAAEEKFHLTASKPTLLVMGGGLGAEALNEVFIGASEELTRFCQVIHLTGRGQSRDWAAHPNLAGNRDYHVYEFLDEGLADAYAAATLVVSRAGFSSLTELAALGKPTIVIPIPDNQQVLNAEFFQAKKAVVYVRQIDLEPEYIVNLIQDLFNHLERLTELSVNIRQVLPLKAADNYVRLIHELID
jgi:UDP-N-acetylglucosamine--N-acetylmuramyl-(pentapeptide) pyrophosphoryl-undecaprenol N-acetylglucosamine transferase